MMAAMTKDEIRAMIEEALARERVRSRAKMSADAAVVEAFEVKVKP